MQEDSCKTSVRDRTVQVKSDMSIFSHLEMKILVQREELYAMWKYVKYRLSFKIAIQDFWKSPVKGYTGQVENVNSFTSGDEAFGLN